MKRTIVIGDIHGADRALEQLLERVNPTPDDRLIFLGDYVDGWSGSKDVISRLVKLEQQFDCLFIRGNHDTWCEDWLSDRGKNEVWLQHGGESTVRSYAFSGTNEREAHLAFFRQLKDYEIDAENNLFIHAGFSSLHGPQKEMYASSYSWDRTLWEMAVSMDKRIEKESKFYPKRLKLFNRIFIGHTPTLDYDHDKPMNAVNVWNLDTGAGFYGKLSAMDIRTAEIWQSDPVRELYPDETGRNKK
jgi:serine/threonine protein phosphatase 1